MEAEIRTAGPEDARGINEVIRDAWLATYPNEALGILRSDIEYTFKDTFTPERIALSQERLKNIPANERRFVAVVEGAVVGVARLMREADANHLQTLYIRPEYQSQGIGTKLWEAMRMFADPSKDTVLEVASYNAQAIGFYESLGFEDTGERIEEERFRMQNGVIIPEMRMRRSRDN